MRLLGLLGRGLLERGHLSGVTPAHNETNFFPSKVPYMSLTGILQNLFLQVVSL